MNIDILKNLGLTKDEEKFIKDSNTAITAEMNQSRNISEMHFIKNLNIISDKIIESNKRYAKRMLFLTKALIFVTCALLFVGIIEILK